MHHSDHFICPPYGSLLVATCFLASTRSRRHLLRPCFAVRSPPACLPPRLPRCTNLRGEGSSAGSTAASGPNSCSSLAYITIESTAFTQRVSTIKHLHEKEQADPCPDFPHRRGVRVGLSVQA